MYVHLDNLFFVYSYFQSPHSTSWKDPALSKVNRFCRESRCMDQWVPIINLPERWTLSCKNPVKGLVSAQKEWCEPWWTHYHPKIKFQSTAEGDNKIWTQLSTWDVFKRRKTALGDGSPLWTGLFGVCLSALATKMRWRGTCIVMRWKCIKACVLFNVKPDTVQKDYIMYVW